MSVLSAPARDESLPVAGPALRIGPWIAVMGVTAAAVALGRVGYQTLAAAGGVLHALLAAPGQTVGPGLIAFVLVVVVLERSWPAVPRPLLSRGHLVDFSYLASFGLIVVPALALVQTGFAVEVDEHLPFLLLDRIPVIPQLLLTVAILVATDGMNWFIHVLNHRAQALWRLHALHHSQEDMSVLTTFRTHPLLHACYVPAALPALVLASSGSVPEAALIVYGCLVTLPHANLRWTFGPLGRVFVSPAFHRLHHAPSIPGRRGSVNFGFVLAIWDRLAGCAVDPSPGVVSATGLHGRPVPVEQSEDRGVIAVVAGQLAQPFALRPSTNRRPSS
jgi:sterol desaturase/sphingolipid hydroxylase (fatty acid hydroxylase superfamily)